MLRGIFSKASSHSSETIDILRLIRSENVGVRTFYALVNMYGSASKALEKASEMSLKGGRQKPIKISSKQDAENELEKLQSIGAKALTYLDDNYPKLLKHISDAPPIISYFGNEQILNKKFCAIVGARNASLNGRNFASHIAKNLSQNSIYIVSGLARGIDTVAHEASLPYTVGVIAGGIDHIYPPENAKLYQKIAETGAIIAELPVGSVPLGQHFPQRNRIIAGMSMVTLVVEASLKSGSLITARMALEQGREVCAVPGFPLDPRCQGTNKLIKEGAHLIESFEDVLEILNQHERPGLLHSLHEKKSFQNFDSISISEDTINQDSREQVLEVLSSTGVQIEEIQKNTELPLPIIYTILLEFELAGKVARLPGGNFIRIFST